MTDKAQYKLMNHQIPFGMGNVRAVITDRKFTTLVKDLFMSELVTATDSAQCCFEAYQIKVQNLHSIIPISKSLEFDKSEILRIHDWYYYAFGAPLYGRKFASQAGSYRFGFNGKEKDDEVKGEGNSLDFGARIYDSRLGRWLSLDPLQKEYPSLSPYNFCANNPIQLVDRDGKKILIYYTDENGKSQSYQYGSKQKVPDNRFVQSILVSLSTIKDSDPIDKSMVNDLTRSNEKSLSIIEQKSFRGAAASSDIINKNTGSPLAEGEKIPASDVVVNTGTIYINPNVGLENFDDFSETSSATTALAHELGHLWGSFFDTKNKFERLFTPDSQYDNMEEKYVIETFEHPVAKNLGEWVRLSHSAGVLIPTSSVCSKDALTTVSSSKENEPVTTESQLGQGTAVEIK